MNNIINDILLESIRKTMDTLVKEGKSVSVHIADNLISTYDDASGQRDSYLSFFSYTSNGINTTEPLKHMETLYYVRRRLSFTNPGDEGKEDAILMTIHMTRIKNPKILKLTNDMIQIDNIILSY